jgi:putative transposase
MDLYHALNRGVDKRVIFQDSQDYARFVHDMFVFNRRAEANNTARRPMVDLRSRPSGNTEDVYETFSEEHASEKLVDIHGWCLMPNHYHLLLSEKCDGGMTRFLRRLNIGYAKYFNKKYDRSGALVQGRTKKILVAQDAHFLHILNYIHLNPLDLQTDTNTWRSGKVLKNEDITHILDTYKWSSYCDYNNTKNFPSILTRELFDSVFKDGYAEQLKEYIKDIHTLPADITLE